MDELDGYHVVTVPDNDTDSESLSAPLQYSLPSPKDVLQYSQLHLPPDHEEDSREHLSVGPSSSILDEIYGVCHNFFLASLQTLYVY